MPYGSYTWQVFQLLSLLYFQFLFTVFCKSDAPNISLNSPFVFLVNNKLCVISVISFQSVRNLI